MAAAVLLAALLFGPLLADTSPTAGAPTYSADSILNAATGLPGFYSPNTFISIYGQNLADTTRAIGPGDVGGGILPPTLPGAEVKVLINSVFATVWYASPTMLNVLIPNFLVAGPATLQIEVDGRAGNPVSITLGATAPAFFQLDATTPIAVHLDGSLITPASPAHGGEMIVLFATGLGQTVPAQIPNQVAASAAQIAALGNFQILLNGAPVDPSRIAYAGAAPGSAGVYQINLLLPPSIPKNPEIRISTGERMSPPGRFLPAQ